MSKKSSINREVGDQEDSTEHEHESLASLERR